MKLVGVVVAFLAVNLASALLPGNSASRLPYQVETPQDQNNPVQFRAYTFAIKYPFGNIQHDDTPTTYDAQVQQAAGEKEKKWDALEYRFQLPAREESVESPLRYQYNVHVPQPDPSQSKLNNFEAFVTRMDFPRPPNCKCDGPCRCQGPQQTFAPMNFGAGLRYRRSTLDSMEREFESRPTKQFQSFKDDTLDTTGDFYKNFQGDDYVLERIES